VRGRVYTVTVVNVACGSSEYDLFEITSSAARPLRIRRLLIGWMDSTSSASPSAIRIIRGYTVSGSGGDTTPDGGALVSTDAASAFTAETMNTSFAGIGTDTYYPYTEIDRAGTTDLSFTEDDFPYSVNQEIIVVRITGQGTTINATLWVEELG
jgi:hypothetical protein